MKKKVFFLNDRVQYIDLYRANLLSFLTQNNYKIEKYSSLTVLLLRKVSTLRTGSVLILISSNLRSNLKVILFYWAPAALIINGLGRYRRSFLRKFIGILLKVRINDSVHIQNYADFRYFRRYFQPKVHWMAGSGGVCRSTGDKGVFFVTRDSKYPLVEPSIKRFLHLRNLEKINMIGLTQLSYDDAKFNSIGYVPQSQLFSYGSEIVIPSGYGEGIPHVLVDAMCSKIIIWLEKKQFIQFGLYKVINEYKTYSGWIRIDPLLNSAGAETFNSEKVSKVFFDAVYNVQSS